jgi:probable rRNA maturation factor
MSEHEVDIAWQGEGGEPRPLLASTREAALLLLHVIAGRPEIESLGSQALQLSILLVDDASIRPMNQRWRGIDRPTDVLSFPMDEGPLLGDVVISIETAQNRLRPGDWTIEDELLFLLIHGVLHLIGHDHIEEDERLLMEEAEQQVWTALGRVGTLRTSQ